MNTNSAANHLQCKEWEFGGPASSLVIDKQGSLISKVSLKSHWERKSFCSKPSPIFWKIKTWGRVLVLFSRVIDFEKFNTVNDNIGLKINKLILYILRTLFKVIFSFFFFFPFSQVLKISSALI